MADWGSLVGGLNAAALAVFGHSVIYKPEAGEPVELRAILQRAHEAEETSPGIYAYAFLRLADLPYAPERGAAVEVGAAEYVIFDVDADGEGGVVLSLRLR